MSQHIDSLRAALADRYAVEREVGQGGMATVYLARDLRHKRPVAIKVLKPELAATLGAERFLGEIEITAHLTHPHILPLHDSGHADGWLYYVMPFVEGESLQDRIDREGALDVGEAVEIAREVASALAYAHEQGVIHRDIKPDNLLLVSGHAVVADFGIARAVTEAGGEGLTGTGAIVGSPAYMSPEQVNGLELDGRADVYALGCVVHEMLTGEPPFVGKGLSLLSSHLHDEVPTVRTKKPEIPQEVAAVVQRALAKPREDRFESATEFGDALRAGARGEALRRNGTLPVTLVAYGAGGWLLFQFIGWIAGEYLLPGWIRTAALGLLLIGLPIFAATAFLHRRRRGGTTRAGRLLSWRNAFASGGLAFAALALGAGGYLGSRALGIGPAASLIAQGTLTERDPLLLADFEGSENAGMYTESLRLELERSNAVALVSPRQLRPMLERMELDPSVPLEEDVAHEVAIREGYKGIITGSIHPLGQGFLLSLRLVTPETGVALISDSERATNEDGLATAIDKLTRRLRRQLGEELRSIRASPGLAQVTTSSLEALRAFTSGRRAEIADDSETAFARYEEAVELDPEFALAWRYLANILSNRAEDRARMIVAATNAFESRDRLPEEERVIIEGLYHREVTRQGDLAFRAEVRLQEIRGRATGQNLGRMYRAQGDYARAEDALLAAIENGSTNSFGVLAEVYVDQGRLDDAADILDQLLEVDPENDREPEARAGLAAARGQWAAAAELFRALTSPDDARLHRQLANVEAIRGRVTEAERAADEILRVYESEGLGGDYLKEVARLAELDVWVAGDRPRALERLWDALRVYPLDSLLPDDRPYGSLARAFATAGDPHEARRLLAAYDAEIKSKPLDWVIDMSWAQAWAAYEEGDATEALSQLDRREAARITSRLDMLALPLRGRVHEMSGQLDSATAVYERYVGATEWGRHRWDDLYLAWVTERLGQLYDELGDFDNAVKHYAAFVELWADADEELQPRVRTAQQRLEEIIAARG